LFGNWASDRKESSELEESDVIRKWSIRFSPGMPLLSFSVSQLEVAKPVKTE
jgi:hypothetical protein